eukprot:gene8034-8895_t
MEPALCNARFVQHRNWQHYTDSVQQRCEHMPLSLVKENETAEDHFPESLDTSHSSLGEYEKDTTKEKPPFSYVALITMAITNAPAGKVTLAEIYDYLTRNFEYFRTRPNRGWMNAVRHNLTLNDCFVKLPRDPLMRGKGSYWCIDPDSKGMFNHGSLKRRRCRYKRSRGEVDVVKDIMLKDYPVRNAYYMSYTRYCLPLTVPKTISSHQILGEPPTKKQFSNFSIDAILAKESKKKTKNVMKWIETESWQC